MADLYACVRKRRYATRNEAVSVHMKVQKKGRSHWGQHVYRCDCGGWHLGHKPRRSADRTSGEEA